METLKKFGGWVLSAVLFVLSILLFSQTLKDKYAVRQLKDKLDVIQKESVQLKVEIERLKREKAIASIQLNNQNEIDRINNELEAKKQRLAVNAKELDEYTKELDEKIKTQGGGSIRKVE